MNGNMGDKTGQLLPTGQRTSIRWLLQQLFQGKTGMVTARWLGGDTKEPEETKWKSREARWTWKERRMIASVLWVQTLLSQEHSRRQAELSGGDKGPEGINESLSVEGHPSSKWKLRSQHGRPHCRDPDCSVPENDAKRRFSGDSDARGERLRHSFRVRAINGLFGKENLEGEKKKSHQCVVIPSSKPRTKVLMNAREWNGFWLKKSLGHLFHHSASDNWYQRWP